MDNPTKRTFYSSSAALSIAANHGHLVQMGSETKRIDEKHINFRPIGDRTATFGIFETTDPELIAFLENRIKEQGDSRDVFEVEEYNTRLYTSGLKPAEKDDAISRLITQNNKLAADLAKQGKLKSA